MLINKLKPFYYFFKRPRFKKNISLCYVFHTEAIHYDVHFNRLIKFCEVYKKITGAKPICVVMPANNARIKFQMEQENVSLNLYVQRVIELSNYADIGYHGHFYKDGYSFDKLEMEIKKYNNQYDKELLTKQFTEEHNWFKENNINIKPVYSGGWWYLDDKIIELLNTFNYTLDFSFSKSPWFWNPFSIAFFKKHNILGGEPFSIGKTIFIQNFVGCHTTPFPQDFIRNTKAFFKDNYSKPIGSVHSHDFDLDYENTLNCISYLVQKGFCQFLSLEELNVKIKDYQLRHFNI